MAESQYLFEGLTLTPAVFVEIALEVAAGRRMKRADLVRVVVEHHVAGGGEPPRTDPLRVAKRALSRMESAGLAVTTAGFGVWSIVPRSDESVTPGGQKEFLYCYYLPTYRLAAEAELQTRWAHKVGMTRVSVRERLASQVGTAMPERPVVAIAQEVENAAAWERAIHAVLEVRGRRLRQAPGAEWFLTNEGEVREIMRLCRPD